ncbi:MAG: tRNA lysidine(34) synthetase TilS [Methylococcaceae bacterium]|jgi:tRNA(Ile)-lysidine synthase
MPILTTDLIIKALQPEQTTANFYLAYSGGIDSQVLLHLCVAIPQIKQRLTAVYVHHGLQTAADAWAEHCVTTAKQWGIQCLVLHVNAAAEKGESPEEAARNARYQALSGLLSSRDVLLLAQHQNDQLETVLLQLFRGSGLRGLSGMPDSMALGLGKMLRPMLAVSRGQIERYACQHQLTWIEDPSNQQDHYDRNYLRNQIVPLLQQRWPAINKTVARAAQHCAESQQLIDAITAQWFVKVYDDADQALLLQPLQILDLAVQHLVVRYWLQGFGLRMPTQAQLEQVFRQIASKDAGKNLILAIQGHVIRCYRNRLYCHPEGDQAGFVDGVWPAEQTYWPVDLHQRLQWVRSSKGILLSRWHSAHVEVRFRAGGEKIALPRRQGRHSLKKLYQEIGIPPWQRPTVPLVYLDGKLAAVGWLWITAEFYSEQSDTCLHLVLKNNKATETP